MYLILPSYITDFLLDLLQIYATGSSFRPCLSFKLWTIESHLPVSVALVSLQQCQSSNSVSSFLSSSSSSPLLIIFRSCSISIYCYFRSLTSFINNPWCFVFPDIVTRTTKLLNILFWFLDNHIHYQIRQTNCDVSASFLWRRRESWKL